MDLDEDFTLATPSLITVADLSAISFAEKIGNVRVWDMLVECYRHDVLTRGTPDALRFLQVSENRLAAAKRHEDDCGEYSLLRLDHPFNLELRHRSERTRAAYERYGRTPGSESDASSGGRQSEKEIISTLGV